MSFSTTIATAAGGIAVGAAVITALSGRSRPVIAELASLDAPKGLPPARVQPVPGRGEMFFRDQAGPTKDAPTVVLVHGWMATADLNWFTVYESLAGVARVIAPDLRGHGRGVRHSQPFRLADVADDVAALLEELGIDQAIIVGYSMGGPITQLLWQRHPERVAGVVLCATASEFGGPFQGTHWRLMSIYQVGARLLPRTWLERTLLAQMRGVLPFRIVQSVGPEVAHMAPLLPWLVGEIERADVEDVAEAGRELGRFDSRGWLRGLDRPAAVVVTTIDRLVAPSDQWQMAALIPDALITEIRADHDAPAAEPAMFNEALREAIAHVQRQVEATTK